MTMVKVERSFTKVFGIDLPPGFNDWDELLEELKGTTRLAKYKTASGEYVERWFRINDDLTCTPVELPEVDPCQ